MRWGPLQGTTRQPVNPSPSLSATTWEGQQMRTEASGSSLSLSAGRQRPRSWSEQRRKAETRRVPRRALNASPLRPVSMPSAEDTWHRGRQRGHRQPPRPPRRSREEGGRDGGGAPAPGRWRDAGRLARALAQAPQLSCLTRARRTRATPCPRHACMASRGRGATRSCGPAASSEPGDQLCRQQPLSALSSRGTAWNRAAAPIPRKLPSRELGRD